MQMQVLPGSKKCSEETKMQRLAVNENSNAVTGVIMKCSSVNLHLDLTQSEAVPPFIVLKGCEEVDLQSQSVAIIARRAPVFGKTLQYKARACVILECGASGLSAGVALTQEEDSV